MSDLHEMHTPAEFEIGSSETCLTAFMEMAQRQPRTVSFTRPANYEWVNVMAAEFVDEVFEVAKGLIACGVEQGDRVALLSSTRYEWSLLDYAIWAAGAVTVPIYPSSSLAQIQWIVEDSAAVLAITETREHTSLMEHLLVDAQGNPTLTSSSSRLRRIVEINTAAVDTLKFEGRQVPTAEVDARIAATSADDLASLVYTSGTTGRPKGCRLTHRNWLSQVRGLLSNPVAFPIARPGKRLVTFLPLAHVLARSVSLAWAISGATQSHWSDFSTLTVELQRTRPNFVLGVPRVFEKVRAAASEQARKGGAVKKLIFDRAEKTAIEYAKAQRTEEGPSRSLVRRHKLYDKLVYSKLRAALGGDVDACVTGGSSMSPDVLLFFHGIGVPLYEGYGLTETVGAACVNHAESNEPGTVGLPLGGVSVRLSADGEVQLRGPIVFDGYWNNAAASAESFDEEGWYNTGDLGEFTPNGFLTITGRKKDLIVTAGGKNVSPGPLEDILREHPLVSQALVVGDGKPFVGALVTLDELVVERWKAEHGVPENKAIKDLASDARLRADIQDAVNVANASVSHAEAIKKFIILGEDFTESGDDLTPTLKVKRNKVTEKYAAAINKLYRR